MAIDTFNKILSTARRLFMQNGYTATSMRQIAEEAGIGKATIYHHFPDKETLVMALLEDNNSRMDEIIQTVQAEMDPRQRIQIATQSSIDYLYEYADIMQIVRREIPEGRGKIQGLFAKFFSQYMALLIEAIQKGSQQGVFRLVDPVEAARVLMTMIQGTFAMAYIVNERTSSPQSAVSALLDVYFNGLDAR